jgi:hypothetical protein
MKPSKKFKEKVKVSSTCLNLNLIEQLVLLVSSSTDSDSLIDVICKEEKTL